MGTYAPCRTNQLFRLGEWQEEEVEAGRKRCKMGVKLLFALCMMSLVMVTTTFANENGNYYM